MAGKYDGVYVISLLLVLSLFCNETHGLDVLSFNIRQFGTTKYSNQDVVNTLIEIVRGYDLILIIELVDVSQTVLPGFTRQLNEAVSGSGIQFNYSVSERVGRSHIKEQYAFLYRIDEVQVLDSYQYPDTNDVFERPPYAVLLRNINQANGDLPPFFIIASHTRPSDAQAEINHLDNVFISASSYFSTSLGAIMGDLNADCSYLSQTRYNSLDLVVNTSFTWWIDNEVDTTTGASDCTYDRIITFSTLTPYVVNGSATVVLFDNLYQLSSTQTAAVSDHYPVKITLRGETSSCGTADRRLTVSVFIALLGLYVMVFV